MSPRRACCSVARLPLVRGFPALRVLRMPPTPARTSISVRCGHSVDVLRGVAPTKIRTGLPGSLALPFPRVPCSQTPPGSPVDLALTVDLPWPSRFSTLSAPGPLSRGSIASLTLRPAPRSAYASLMSSPPQAQGSIPGGAAYPLPVRELHPLEAPGLAWRTEASLDVPLDCPWVREPSLRRVRLAFPGTQEDPKILQCPMDRLAGTEAKR